MRGLIRYGVSTGLGARLRRYMCRLIRETDGVFGSHACTWRFLKCQVQGSGCGMEEGGKGEGGRKGWEGGRGRDGGGERGREKEGS